MSPPATAFDTGETGLPPHLALKSIAAGAPRPLPAHDRISDRLAGWLRRGDGLELRRLRDENAILANEIELQRRRIEQLHRLSTTDELTGLNNRRGFEEAMQRTLSAARRHHDGGALAYLDCDDFKSINDRHGHAAGDAALMAIAAILKRDTRTSDVIARLHGDEFAVLLVRSGSATGMARLRLLEHVVNQSSVSFQGATIPLRVSLGIVGYDGHDEVEELVQRADRAMYARKEERRAGECYISAPE
jgi:diguanylate cyclase (GGDEF)-like protein